MKYILDALMYTSCLCKVLICTFTICAYICICKYVYYNSQKMYVKLKSDCTNYKKIVSLSCKYAMG